MNPTLSWIDDGGSVILSSFSVAVSKVSILVALAMEGLEEIMGVDLVMAIDVVVVTVVCVTVL